LASLPLTGKVIYIDIGHGGVDPGSTVGNIYEKDINLKIGLALEKELIKMGATVYTIRDGDYDLGSPNSLYRKKSDFDHRISLINASDADFYVSIHLNFLEDSRYSGAQVFYDNNFEINKLMAESIQSYLNNSLKTNRVTKKIPGKTYMYSKLEKPGILIECGFLSNYAERNLLNTEEYQNKIAKLIAESFAKF